MSQGHRGNHESDPPFSALTSCLLGTLAFLPAPTKDGRGCPHSRPDPGEGDACDGQLSIKSHIAKRLADHQPPLPGNDGQGPEACDPCRGEQTDDDFEPPTSLLPYGPANSFPGQEALFNYLQNLTVQRVLSGPGGTRSLGQFLFLTRAFPFCPTGPLLAPSDSTSWSTLLSLFLSLGYQPLL